MGDTSFRGGRQQFGREKDKRKPRPPAELLYKRSGGVVETIDNWNRQHQARTADAQFRSASAAPPPRLPTPYVHTASPAGSGSRTPCSAAGSSVVSRSVNGTKSVTLAGRENEFPRSASSPQLGWSPPPPERSRESSRFIPSSSELGQIPGWQPSEWGAPEKHYFSNSMSSSSKLAAMQRSAG